MHKKQLINRKPAYRHGQLLLENDFIAEQDFHCEARYLHARALHGFGVVNGLDVTRDGDLSITISPGFAVDRKGHDIALLEPQTLELSGLPPGSLAWVTIGYRTEHAERGPDSENRIDCYAWLRIAIDVEPGDIRLARAQLDERGRLDHKAISHTERDQFRTHLSPGSVTAEALDPQLRRDWITMPFHPTRMPQDEDDSQPPFRVGATQARAHREWEGKPNEKGSAGTMPLIPPPGIQRIHRLRIAGATNEKSMRVTLVKGGFDPGSKTHLREEIAAMDIEAGGYFRTIDIPEAHQPYHDHHRTLAVDVRSKGYATVSLVALEVSY
jgi:hypothetical protein